MPVALPKRAMRLVDGGEVKGLIWWISGWEKRTVRRLPFDVMARFSTQVPGGKVWSVEREVAVVERRHERNVVRRRKKRSMVDA